MFQWIGAVAHHPIHDFTGKGVFLDRRHPPADRAFTADYTAIAQKEGQFDPCDHQKQGHNDRWQGIDWIIMLWTAHIRAFA